MPDYNRPLIEKIEALELHPNFNGHYHNGFSQCRAVVLDIIRQHTAAPDVVERVKNIIREKCYCDYDGEINAIDGAAKEIAEEMARRDRKQYPNSETMPSIQYYEEKAREAMSLVVPYVRPYLTKREAGDDA